MRAPFQVLVFPFIRLYDHIEYAVFKRVDSHCWQGIAGGGEYEESPIDAARRESFEEAGVSYDSDYIKLDTISSIPVESVVGKFLWGRDTYVVNEHCFGVEVLDKDLSISSEHIDYKWMCYDDAIEYLKWDSNKTALWELNKRLSVKG